MENSSQKPSQFVRHFAAREVAKSKCECYWVELQVTERRRPKHPIRKSIWVFPKIGAGPQIINSNGVFPYKPSILGVPLFLETPILTKLCPLGNPFYGKTLKMDHPKDQPRIVWEKSWTSGMCWLFAVYIWGEIRPRYFCGIISLK